MLKLHMLKSDPNDPPPDDLADKVKKKLDEEWDKKK